MEYSIPAEVIGQAELSSFATMDESYMENMISSVSQAIQPSTENTQPDPIDYLKKVMEQRGLRNKDLKIYIGSSGNVCSVLKRRKPLTLRMIRNLHKYLGIPAEILIQPYNCH